MRIALISDLHGNEVALDAVLDDAARSGVDRVVCLGDTATLGPRPSEVLDRLRNLGCDCILGNHDDFLLDAELIHSYTEAPIIVEAVDWCRDLMTAQDLELLRSFKATLRIELNARSSLLLFHGSPRSHMEDLLATTPPDQIDEALAGQVADIMAGGHTHLQLLRQHRGALLVNPGSVGMPFREYVAGRAPVILPHAEYAIVEASETSVGVVLRRVDFDLEAHRRSIVSTDNPLRGMLLAQY